MVNAVGKLHKKIRQIPGYGLASCRNQKGCIHTMSKPKKIITEYRNYYLPLQFPAILLSGDYWKISDVPSGRLHFHNCLEIGVCHSDSGTLEFYGNPLPFKEGDVTCIPRNIPHTTYSTRGTESHWSYLYLDPEELFRNLLPNSWMNYDLSFPSGQTYKYILSRSSYPLVHNLVLQVIAEMENKKPGYQLSARGLLLALYVELYRIQHEAEPIPPDGDNRLLPAENALMIAPALDYIEQNYASSFSIEHLATLCHWSPTHFRRIFHEIRGISPLEHVNNTRIMNACKLLRSTEDSILDISESTGFHSVSSFNRFFIKIMKVPPREYRKQMALADKKESQSILEYAGWLYPEKT